MKKINLWFMVLLITLTASACGNNKKDASNDGYYYYGDTQWGMTQEEAAQVLGEPDATRENIYAAMNYDDVTFLGHTYDLELLFRENSLHDAHLDYYIEGADDMPDDELLSAVQELYQEVLAECIAVYGEPDEIDMILPVKGQGLQTEPYHDFETDEWISYYEAVWRGIEEPCVQEGKTHRRNLFVVASSGSGNITISFMGFHNNELY